MPTKTKRLKTKKISTYAKASAGRPKLRFSGFSDEWEENKLGDICGVLRGAKLSKSDIVLEGKYEYIMYGELFTKYNEVITAVKSKTNVNIEPKSEIGDILMPTSDVTPNGLATASALLVSGVMLGGDINIIRSKEDNLDSVFLSYMINIQRKKVMRLVTGTTIKHVYAKDIKSISYYFPQKQEQQKIAEFLSIVDKWIENLQLQRESLEVYKKGMMQKFFSQEIRFKDDKGKDFSEWEEKKLEDVAKFWNGKAHEQSILENGKYIVVNSKFISQNGNIKKYSDKQFSPLKKDDITIVMSDIPNGKAIGKCFLIDKNKRYTLNQRIGGINSKQIISSFLIRILNRNKYFLKFDNGVSQTNLRKDEILKCPIIFPSLSEQQKIAEFLTSIDNLIDSKQEQIEKAKKWKKGLMQELFI